MSSRWTIRLDRADAASLAPLRLGAEVEVAEAPSGLWLRGTGADDGMQRLLRSLPAVARYEWLPQDRLRPLESRIPAETFPPLTWQPLDRWLEVERPIVALPGLAPRPVPLLLVRSGDETEPGLLWTDLDAWTRFALACAELRLRPLRFAANADGQVLVRGRPLPPLPGRRFVAHGPLAIPAGYTWEPAVSLAVLLRCFALSADALVLWREDGTFTRLHAEQFLAATRSAVRATGGTDAA